MTPGAIEVHGYTGCPFAWRVRLAATLKGVPFEWLPCNMEPSDTRCGAHNPAHRSPLLYDDGFSLTESSVIVAYLDESREGPPLQPAEPRERAMARLAIAELCALALHVPEELDASKRQKVDDALALLERKLAAGRPFLDGDRPGLVDVHVWTSLGALAANGIAIPGTSPATEAYWQRSRAHPAFVSTPKPVWDAG